MTFFDVKKYLSFWGKKVEDWLNDNITEYSPIIAQLNEAMRYSLFAGGKRIRPALVFSSYGIFDSYFDKVTPFAAAVEMLHTYSLIHDDLPAMDNDDFRRGKPTNHKMFGEAEAILAGDALLTKSFEIMLDRNINPDVEDIIMIEAAKGLALAAGESGMVGGQFADIKAEGGNYNAEIVEFIHKHKTAAMISYSVELGAVLGYAEDDDRLKIKSFGDKIGLAFQVVDDILDITSSTEELGKDAGSDLEKDKATYPMVYGIDKSKKIAQELVDDAFDIISHFGAASDPLKAISSYIINRTF